MRKTKNVMKGLTAKEEEIMGFFWEKGPLFVKEMLAFYEEPKPHFNTLSTIVRGLEDKGFLSHHTYGNTYQYYAVVSIVWCTSVSCFTLTSTKGNRQDNSKMPNNEKRLKR